MSQGLVMQAWAIVQDGCPIVLTPENDESVKFVCGNPRQDAVELVFSHNALRALVELGSEYLERLHTAGRERGTGQA